MSDESGKPWLQGGARSEAEAQAAQLLRAAVKLEQLELEKVQPGRISARLAQRLAEGEWPARPRTWRFLAGLGLGLATALTLVLIVAGVNRNGGAQEGAGLVVSGEVRVTDARGERLVAAGGVLALNSQLVAANGEAMLRLRSRANVNLQPQGRLQLSAQGQPVLVAGAAEFEVDKRQPAEAAFVVKADDVVVTVVGTRFVVSTSEASGVSVLVTEGRVKVDSSAGSRFVDPSTGEWRSKPRSEALFDDAARLTRQGRFQEARDLYSTLSGSTSASAETALYLEARLEARELGDADRALRLLETSARRFPLGSLARERLQLQLEALVALKRCEAARQVLAELQRAFPGEALDEASLGAACRR